MRVAVLGAGKIGSAIIKAVTESGLAEVMATGRREVTLENARRLGAVATRDNRAAVEWGEVIILSVKPHHFPKVLAEVGPEAWAGKVVASVMAGVSLRTLRHYLRGAEVFRAMPNINALVKKSSTAVAGEKGSEAAAVVEKIFSALGRVYWVPEDLIDAWTGLAGSGPAYIAEIVDGLILGALAVGMPRDLALETILDVLEGTAELLRRYRMHPAQMRDEVTTPAGTTIAGLSILEAEGVKAALIKTVKAATERATEINRLIDARIRNHGL